MENALGQHVLVEYYGVSAILLDDVYEMESCMLGAARAADATIVQVGFHHFSPVGVSGVVVIQESHLTIHTWPEYGYAAVDIFTCGDTVDPLQAHQFLVQKFKPVKIELNQLERGKFALDAGPQSSFLPNASPDPQPIHIQRDNWFTTRQQALATSLRLVGNRLYKLQSNQQLIEVYESEIYGRFMALDRQIVISEKDEGHYHEMLVHTCMKGFQDAQKVAVLGGGDGGLVRELLRYPRLKNIEVMEWDEKISEVVGRFFPALMQGLKRPRVTLRHDSIQLWLAEKTPLFDLVLVDFSIATFELAQLKGVNNRLSQEGRLMACLPNPQLEADLFWNTWTTCMEVFGKEDLWLGRIAVPTLPGGAQYVVYVGPGPLASRTEEETMSGLHVYNEAMHRAIFALPNDLLQKIRESSCD